MFLDLLASYDDIAKGFYLIKVNSKFFFNWKVGYPKNSIEKIILLTLFEKDYLVNSSMKEDIESTQCFLLQKSKLSDDAF